MNGKEAIQHALRSSQKLFNWYLSDLSDADLLVRPVSNANHIAWQLGHLISAELMFGKQLNGAIYPPLPAGFADQHAKATSTQDTGFKTKQEYVALFNQARETTIASVEKLSEKDLDHPTQGDIAKFAPTLGDLLLLAASHVLMHAGQFTVVRRKLGKPVLF
jgi:uncharacterized damage-inducible protein DinB